VVNHKSHVFQRGSGNGFIDGPYVSKMIELISTFIKQLI